MSNTKYEIIVTHRLTDQKYKHIMNASLAKVNRIKKTVPLYILDESNCCALHNLKESKLTLLNLSILRGAFFVRKNKFIYLNKSLAQ